MLLVLPCTGSGGSTWHFIRNYRCIPGCCKAVRHLVIRPSLPPCATAAAAAAVIKWYQSGTTFSPVNDPELLVYYTCMFYAVACSPRGELVAQAWTGACCPRRPCYALCTKAIDFLHTNPIGFNMQTQARSLSFDLSKKFFQAVTRRCNNL